MRRHFLFASLLLLLPPAASTAAELPSVTRCAIDARFLPGDQRVSVRATLTVMNTTAETHAELPFLLYRLLGVRQVRGRAGGALPFTQSVVALGDEPTLQANAVTVSLGAPLRPGDSATVELEYEGFIFGYPEVMAYVRDRIDETYSLLRPDAFAFPVLARPSFASAFAADDARFTYELSATVPKGYRVACGGALVDSFAGRDSTTFRFRSKMPTWRIDVAVARFGIAGSPGDQLSVYHLPEDSAGARRVLAAAGRVIGLFSGMFGRPESYQGYTIIEIPDGWGSQAGDAYLLQTAAAFRDSGRLPEVYHEIGHTWNAPAAPEVQRCRYFDEAFASFLAAIAIRSFRGREAFQEEMERSRSRFAEWCERDRAVFETPIASYGAKELGRHSYTKGAWSLYVLSELVGDEAFAAIIRTMSTDGAGRAVDFRAFQELCERTSGRDLDAFFREWIYGTESSRLLAEKIPVAEIAKRY